MAYTSHGWHIDGSVGTNRNKRLPNSVDCGGPEECPKCNVEFTEYVMTGSKVDVDILLSDNHAGNQNVNYQRRAMALVREYVLKNYIQKAIGEFSIYIVWFAKTLQNWKALVCTDMLDGRYYEVTYNGDKKETYLDTYVKIDNVVIPD